LVGEGLERKGRGWWRRHYIHIHLTLAIHLLHVILLLVMLLLLLLLVDVQSLGDVLRWVMVHFLLIIDHWLLGRLLLVRIVHYLMRRDPYLLHHQWLNMRDLVLLLLLVGLISLHLWLVVASGREVVSHIIHVVGASSHLVAPIPMVLLHIVGVEVLLVVPPSLLILLVHGCEGEQVVHEQLEGLCLDELEQ
jgi:hypothetical protein